MLTDALRAALLRLNGYRVDVVEFVDSAHTPRNLLLRARRTGAAPTRGAARRVRGADRAVGCDAGAGEAAQLTVTVHAAVCTRPATWKSKNIR